jgi:hypothetical protein
MAGPLLVASTALFSRERGPRVAYKRAHLYRSECVENNNVMFLVSLLVNLLIRALNEPDEDARL